MSDQYLYPFDPTGKAASNKVVGEQQILSPPSWTDFYFIIPKMAPFFREGLKLVHMPSGRELVEGIDYHLTHQFKDATIGTAKPVYGSITFLDKQLTGVVSLTYQTLGGRWILDEQKIIEILSNTKLNPRITTWEQVIGGMPVKFPPIDHEWHVDDLIGMKEVVDATIAIAEALGAEGGVGESHIADRNNPHRVTKAQVGLDKVENYPVATREEAEQGTANNRYMTPERTKQAIQVQVASAVNDHAERRDNPHGTTKEQVGLSEVPNWGPATGEDAVAGIAGDKIMSPATTRQAVDAWVGNTLRQHIEDQNNPHGTTKKHVGLEYVENYPVASQEEAEQGVANNRYMTPERTKQAIQAQVTGAVSEHVERKDNPHETTKEQVGLSEVPNWGPATIEDAVIGTADDKIMSPATTRQAVDVWVGNALQQHIDEVTFLLGQKLGVNDKAADSALLDGMDINGVLNYVAWGLDDRFTSQYLIPSPTDGVSYILIGGVGYYDPSTPTVEPDLTVYPYEPDFNEDGEIIRYPDLVFLLTGIGSDYHQPTTVHLVRVSREPKGDVEVFNLTGAQTESKLGITLGENGEYHLWLKGEDKRTRTTLTILSPTEGFNFFLESYADEPPGIIYLDEITLWSAKTLPKATEEQARRGEDDSTFMTPKKTREAVVAVLNEAGIRYDEDLGRWVLDGNLGEDDSPTP